MENKNSSLNTTIFRLAAGWWGHWPAESKANMSFSLACHWDENRSGLGRCKNQEPGMVEQVRDGKREGLVVGLKIWKIY